jgi:PKD repeat protein
VDGTTLAVTPINKITNAPDLSGSGIGALSAAWTASEDGFERTITQAMYQAESARTRYLWDFGDGAISTEENPTKVYGAVGTYTVSLQVVTAQMWADTVIKTNFITVRSSLPVLSISRSGANVAIKWTTVQPGFGLESKASLNALSWWAVSQAPLVTGNSYTVTLPITGNQFFRLRKP